MADNTIINPGVSGDTIRDIDRGGIKTQVMALDIGGQGMESLVSPTNPVPTADTMLQLNSVDQPLYVAVSGSPGTDWEGEDIFAQVLDPANGVGFSVNVLNPAKSDSQDALILSDAPDEVRLVIGAGGVHIIDTQGYQTLQLSSAGMSASVQISNDRLSWSQVTGVNPNTLTVVSNIQVSGPHVYPCVARYFRLVVSTGGAITYFLRNVPFPTWLMNIPVNIATVGGSGLANVGAAGGFAWGVGGSSAVGQFATNAGNPIITGGTDTNGQIRRVLTDVAGHFLTASVGLGPASVNYTPGALAITLQGTPALNVQDTSQTEGYSTTDLLFMILTELRVMNHQLYELPRLINAGQAASDEPDDLRDELSLQ